MKLIIGYLYGNLMNIYGDTGNIIALKKRAEWRGIKIEIKNISIGDRLPTSKVGAVDLYFFGGGQDQQQRLVAKDLKSKAKIIKSAIERGVPLLSVCGGYQLLGEYYKPHKGEKLQGIGIFKAHTEASNERMIGNIVIDSMFGKLVGFENHSGKTYLKKDSLPFGMVLKGFGNNGNLPAMQDGKALPAGKPSAMPMAARQAGDKTEGCMYKNAIGCYMHGSLLPKNPKLADWLLKKALEVKYKKAIELNPLDDSFENQAHLTTIRKILTKK